MSDQLDAIDMAAMRRDTERHLRDDTGCRSCAQNVLRLLAKVEPFPATVHIEPIPAPAGVGHGDGFAFELQHVTCEACKAGVVAAVRAQRPVERQTWERRLGGTDVAEVRIHLEVDTEGRVRLHEALAARLLHEAGWERTA